MYFPGTDFDLSGYTKKLEKLVSSNLGLPSRFPHRFHFEDFSDDELLTIFSGLLERSGKDVTHGLDQPEPKKAPTVAVVNSAAKYGRAAAIHPFLIRLFLTMPQCSTQAWALMRHG